MSAPQLVALGGPDPHQASDGQQLCSDRSDVVDGMVDALRCTRALGHPARGLGEHVASAPYESRLPIAVGAWVTGGAPRLMDTDR